MPDLYTNFPSENPFYGGIALTWGAGKHQDLDPTTDEKEIIRADYLNRWELRIERLEDVVNQIEHELLYPHGSINASGVASGIITEEVPASGEWYLSSRLDRLSSDVNTLLVRLGNDLKIGFIAEGLNTIVDTLNSVNRLGRLALDFNAMAAALDASGIIGSDVLTYYPHSTEEGILASGLGHYPYDTASGVVVSGTAGYYPHHVGSA